MSINDVASAWLRQCQEIRHLPSLCCFTLRGGPSMVPRSAPTFRRGTKELRVIVPALTSVTEPLSEGVTMPITCCIQYTLDPRKVDAFEEYASRWPPIIGRCGGDLVGYYLPKEGANNFALALIDFPSLAAYEDYRQRLREDPEADRNFTDAQDAACILVESRTFLRRV